MEITENSKSIESPITKEFLEKILKRKITSFIASEGTNPGDNFTTNLISLKILLPDNQDPLHLLFKTFPQHPTRQKLLQEGNIFLKEFQIYSIWLQELVDFQKSINDKDQILKPAMPELVAGAAIKYSSKNSQNCNDLDPILNNYLLMTDVRKLGFKMANKMESLGYHHVKCVLKELAKYHALGYAYKVHNNLPNIRSKFPFIEDPYIIQPNFRPTLVAMTKLNMEIVNDSCKDLLEAKPEIAKSLKKYMDSELPADYYCKFLNPDGIDETEVTNWMRDKPKEYSDEILKDQWIVSSHGDCWTNNILFKENENGIVTDAVLVDLQVARETCLMTDIAYFIYTSTDGNFRKEYLNEMLNCYVKYFVHFCGILKVEVFPGFNFENFKRKFRRSKIFGFLYAAMALPIILQKAENTVNLDNMEMDGSGGGDDNEGKGGNDDAEEYIRKMYENSGRGEEEKRLLSNRLTEILEELYEEGVL